MPSYRISFFKNMLSSDGHPFKCVQEVIEIRHARNADHAVQAAERRYQDLRGIHDWKLHADYLELEVNGKKVDYCPTRVRRKGLGKTPVLCSPFT
jgi:hypothetical protein